MKITLGVIGSSQGGVIIAAAECLREAGYNPDFIVLSDRKCGLLDWAKRSHYQYAEIQYWDKDTFSADALEFFQGKNCQDVLLFYTRMLAKPLIEELSVCNIHPSLLPAFKGLHAVKQAMEARVMLFGATLHRVNERLDEGQILAQVAMPVEPNLTLEQANRLSYLQKIWLTLLWVESLGGKVKNSSASDRVGNTIMISNKDLTDLRLKKAFMSHAHSLN